MTMSLLCACLVVSVLHMATGTPWVLDCDGCRFGSFQNKVCDENNQWVILGKVVSVNKANNKYKVEIQKIYKPKGTPQIIFDLLPVIDIETVRNNKVILDCQVFLKKSKVYVLSGSINADGKWHMDMCNNINFMPTKKFLLDNFETLEPFFLDNCDCEVKPVKVDGDQDFGPDADMYVAEKTSSNCVASYEGMECANHLLVCAKQTDGSCDWTKQIKTNNPCKKKTWFGGGYPPPTVPPPG